MHVSTAESSPAAPAETDRPRRHVAWVNQHAAFVGGCEHYVARTARLLRAEGVRSTLLYDVDGELEKSFIDEFDAAFPRVDLRLQLKSLDADMVYAHRVNGLETARELAGCGLPLARFFHDHRLFCLREHKYTTIGSRTCTQTVGLGCYACLGFLQRSDAWPGIEIRSLGDLRCELAACRNLDALVVGSDYMQRQLSAHGFDAQRICTAPLYVEGDASCRAEQRGDLLVFAGQLVRGKGLDTLLEALPRLLNPARLVVAGDGRQREELQRSAAALPVDVEFVGRLDGPQLRRLVRRAAVFVMPSRSPETFGLAGLEAIAEGTPVVASDVGGVSQWLKHEHCGLLTPPNDSSALADAIDRLLRDPVWSRQLGENGIRLSRERFTPRAHVDRLLAMFDQIAPVENA